ncbi:23559_t:CDS:2 [Dentiscutata erythropus]|uniref:23559_t:CDS:1 n=1 Tax=Dentiscutata erythropus TaxID=1348616 RepID=A0A9N9C400_9GLOM|nr:23559_t:CDS:2 [Dentiscutata erythropus]
MSALTPTFSLTTALLPGVQEFSLDLLLAADELALFDLVTHIQSHIIASERPWLLKNLIKVYQFSELTNNFSKLRDHCQEIIDKTPDLVFGSNDFAKLDLSTLISLLKRDDLSVKEIDIWNHVIDWGICQHPPFNPNISIWTDDDFETLKSRVQQALIHIRFFNISHNDFKSKIIPFKKILSNQLYERLEDHHITFGSELISSRQAALITCWIEEREFSFEKTELLATNRSFIFSMDNDDNNLKNSILSRVSPAGCAIFNHGYAPDKIGFGRDLMWFNGTSLHSDYEKNIFMPDNFNMVRFYEKNFFRPDTFDVIDFEAGSGS